MNSNSGVWLVLVSYGVVNLAVIAACADGAFGLQGLDVLSLGSAMPIVGVFAVLGLFFSGKLRFANTVGAVLCLLALCVLNLMVWAAASAAV